MKQATQRRDLSAERRGEILDGFAAAIQAHGLAGSSMRRIAARAGVSQPLLLHHFGSRAGLVEALVLHVLARYDAALEGALGALADGDEGVLLDVLFGGRFTDMVSRDDGIFPALQDAATRDEQTRAVLVDVYVRFRGELAAHLADLYPTSSSGDCDRVAYGLMCLAESNELMRELGLPGRRPDDAVEIGRSMLRALGEPLPKAARNMQERQ
ncbi:MAG: TetR/AcrR family transcriptional regulator [Actinomycetota bacterium]